MSHGAVITGEWAAAEHGNFEKASESDVGRRCNVNRNKYPAITHVPPFFGGRGW